MSFVEQQAIICNGEKFVRGTYNGIAVLIREKDGFINATEMCKQFNKRYAKINENHSWQEYYKAFCDEYTTLPKMGGFHYVLNSGVTKDLRGTYVDPRLINYIAIWASPKYAITVGKIMDSINDKVHEVLEEKQLQDTIENAKPVFVEVAKQIAPSVNQELVNQKCWGVRDSAYNLNCWEQQDLSAAIINYKKIKQRLEDAERKIDEFGEFVKRHHSEFEK
ncbi:N1R/p28-like protein [Histomonas meleagridis]|nr:N1R/p28-like protein [Histomonas meleagridis]